MLKMIPALEKLITAAISSSSLLVGVKGSCLRIDINNYSSLGINFTFGCLLHSCVRLNN